MCLAILSPLICWFVDVDKKYDHMSLSLLGHTMQGGLGGQNIYSYVITHVLHVSKFQRYGGLCPGLLCQHVVICICQCFSSPMSFC